MDTNIVVKAQRRKKEFAVNQFGGKCSICGYNKCLGALEFHHIGKKDHDAGYVVQRWSWKRAKKELEKCILVCSNCHREIHELQIDHSLVRYLKTFKTKECTVCKKLFDTKDYERKFCSQECTHLAQHKVKHPTKEQLQQLLDKNISWLQIGRMFDVSDNAVRKWAKNLGCKL